MSDEPDPPLSEDAAALLAFLRTKRVIVRQMREGLLIVSDGGLTGWHITVDQASRRE